MPTIFPNDRIAIFGQTGSGKSILSHYIFWTVEPSILTDAGEVPMWRLIIDVSNSVDDPATTFDDPTKIPWEEDTSLRFVPDANALDNQIELLYQSVLAHGYCFMWLDEANEISNAHKTIPGLRKVLLQGRKMFIGHLAVSPRPADLVPTIVSQSQHLFIFLQTLPDDINRLAGITGIDYADLEFAIKTLPPYAYLWYSVRDRETFALPPLPPDIVELMTIEQERQQ